MKIGYQIAKGNIPSESAVLNQSGVPNCRGRCYLPRTSVPDFLPVTSRPKSNLDSGPDRSGTRPCGQYEARPRPTLQSDPSKPCAARQSRGRGGGRESWWLVGGRERGGRFNPPSNRWNRQCNPTKSKQIQGKKIRTYRSPEYSESPLIPPIHSRRNPHFCQTKPNFTLESTRKRS